MDYISIYCKARRLFLYFCHLFKSLDLFIETLRFVHAITLK